ncbi:MAG: hypothetical protein QOH95_579 [Gaiellaceae bacterium]|nr:hypothetical protein [Gaiellaceae bacterium]
MASSADFQPGIRSGRNRVIARLTTETKQAFKTTEFWTMVVIALGVLIASRVVGDDNGNANGHDAFPAVRAWMYVTILAAAYMVARGLAKAGSRDPYWADENDLPGARRNDDDN